jgi:DNA-directed RNA polymerase subunit K/omega
MSKNQHQSLETCYSKDISPFKSVIMSAQEARFIKEQANLGFIKLNEKPTTIAIQNFKDGKLVMLTEGEQV